MSDGIRSKTKMSLQDVLEKQNIKTSLEHLLTKNVRGQGSDGIRVSQFQEYWQINGQTILRQLLDGEYEPDIVLEQERVNAKGKIRGVSMFTCKDRLILRAISQLMMPACEKIFSEHCHAYRIEHGTGTAINMATTYLNEGYSWVAEIDIEKFFDVVPIVGVEERMAEYFEMDDKLLQLINRYLRCRLENDGKVTVKQMGLVQGSPLSPMLSNLYLTLLDYYMEKKGYAFVRFADDINIYAKNDREASDALQDVTEQIHTLSLHINKDKSGVFETKNRYYLGYHFEKKDNKYLASNKKINQSYYQNWHSTAVQKIEKNYHIINNGVLTKQDYTLLFENESGKRYLPIEVMDSLNIYSDIIFTSNFFSFVSRRKLRVTIFDKYANGVGTFTGKNNGSLAKTMLKQSAIYLDEKRRLEIAKKIMIAAMHNIRSNLKYYYKQKRTDEINEIILFLSEIISSINEAVSIDALMIAEARGRQKYYRAFNYIISNEDFKFVQRTRRPPKDAINALVSFGNTYLYNRIATEIMKTSLDIRIGFVHATNNRDESLNLDIAELFKPIIVDRVIFTMINRRMIDATIHFEEVENGGIYLNKLGKKIFLEELERKIYSQINVDHKTVSNDTLMREEVKKIYRMVIYDEKYKPYKYTN